MKRVIPLALLFIFILVSQGRGESIIQEGEVLNLERCIEIALMKNPTIVAAKGTVGVNESRVYASEVKLLSPDQLDRRVQPDLTCQRPFLHRHSGRHLRDRHFSPAPPVPLINTQAASPSARTSMTSEGLRPRCKSRSSITIPPV